MTDHPTNEEVKELAVLIDRVNQKQLDFLVKRVRKRISSINEEKALDALEHASPGKRVRTSNLKPQYLNGLTAEIVSVTDNKIRIKPINPPIRFMRRWTSGEVVVPASCCTVID